MCLSQNLRYNRSCQYYERKFPHTDTQISRFSRITEGWETEIYSFILTHKTAKPRTHKGLILRVYPGEDALQKSEKEFHVMNQLYKMGYNTTLKFFSSMFAFLQIYERYFCISVTM